MNEDKLKVGDICPHCKEGKIIFIKGNEPYDVDHLMCNLCNSTYILEEDDRL